MNFPTNIIIVTLLLCIVNFINPNINYLLVNSLYNVFDIHQVVSLAFLNKKI